MIVATPSYSTCCAAEIVRGDLPGGPSTSQTIMVSSLQRLLSLLPPGASPEAYRSAVMEDNILGKTTTGGREWAFRQLRRFYALDPRALLFRALRDDLDDLVVHIGRHHAACPARPVLRTWVFVWVSRWVEVSSGL
jgi:hypothetical protein